MRAGFQFLRRSALAKFVTGDPSKAGHGENASPKTPHGAYRNPLKCNAATPITLTNFQYIDR